MIKQKIRTLILMVLPFGTSVSFMRCFVKNSGSVWAGVILTAGLLFLLTAVFFPKMRKTVLEQTVKLQPLAAVVFTASFILSFLPYSMMWPQLFSVLVLSTICLCMAFENLKSFNYKTFLGLLCAGALIGAGTALSSRVGLIYVCFVVLSLLCRPKTTERTVQEIWKDIAFPLFVLVSAFVSFIAANHDEAFPFVIAESIVMLMIGGLLAMPSSSLRLTLMTIVMMIFGSYVFSTQNADSIFNRSGESLLQKERSL